MEPDNFISEGLDAPTNGSTYSGWTGGTNIDGAWIGPWSGTCGWDTDGGNPLSGNSLESPFNSVGIG